MASTRLNKDEFKMSTEELLAEIDEAISYLKARESRSLSEITRENGILQTLSKSLATHKLIPDPEKKFKTALQYGVIDIRAVFQRDGLTRLYLPFDLIEKGINVVMKYIPDTLSKKGYWLGKENTSATLLIASQLGDPKAVLQASLIPTSVAAEKSRSESVVVSQQSVPGSVPLAPTVPVSDRSFRA